MYQSLAVILQSVWAFGLYALLCAMRVNLQAIRLTVIACVFSGFVLVNSFFMWPKPMAAAFILAFTAAVLSPQLLSEMKNSLSKSCWSDLFWYFQFCRMAVRHSHCLGCFWRSLYSASGKYSAELVAVILISCVCFCLPWMSYQTFYDPPGDRLPKWHLAGVREFAPKSFLKTLMNTLALCPFHQSVRISLRILKLCSPMRNTTGPVLAGFRLMRQAGQSQAIQTHSKWSGPSQRY